MIIYRFEHPDTGVGPYRSTHHRILSPELEAMLWEHQDITHPSPQMSDLPIYGYKFAFSSILQVNSWFDKEVQDLLYDEGFEMLKLEVPDDHVKASTLQVAYIPDDSKLLMKAKA